MAICRNAKRRGYRTDRILLTNSVQSKKKREPARSLTTIKSKAADLISMAASPTHQATHDLAVDRLRS